MTSFTTRDAVVITVELFGMARMNAGVSSIALEVVPRPSIAALLHALADQCPALTGCALHTTEDGVVTLADGYALNRNGLAFLSPDLDAALDLEPGDSLLFLSNQAGG